MLYSVGHFIVFDMLVRSIVGHCVTSLRDEKSRISSVTNKEISCGAGSFFHGAAGKTLWLLEALPSAVAVRLRNVTANGSFLSDKRKPLCAFTLHGAFTVVLMIAPGRGRH